MIIINEKKSKQEGSVTLQQALDEIADWPRGVVVSIYTRCMKLVFSSIYFDFDPETTVNPNIEAQCNKQSFGGLIVYPKTIRRVEHATLGYKFTLSDGSWIEVVRN